MISSSRNKEGEELVEVSNHPNWVTFSNHRDISLIFFFNNNLILFLLNVYSNLSQLALKYLKDTEVNINNVLIMTGNFNIRDNL